MESFGYLFIDMKDPELTIRSELGKEGREGGIAFYAFDHTIRIPDMHGRRGDGVPFHGPIKLTKQADENSPKLQKLLCLMMSIPEITLKWFKSDQSGTPKQVYAIHLEKCAIIGIHTLVDDVREVEQAKISEEVFIDYRKIRWESGQDTGMFFDFDTAVSFSPGGGK